MRTFYSIILVFICCSSLLFGCGGKVQEIAEVAPSQPAQINCIAVLPVASVVHGQAVPIYLPKGGSERQGVQAMNEILSDELGGKDKIRFFGIDQVDSLTLTGGENQLTLARMVGEKMNCNGVLESTVRRFKERVGGRYSIETPASVAFAMRLISIDSGRVVWSAKFDESQKSVMENILEWNKANTRGFTWITAEELMREGIKSKFASSPYFSK